MSGTFPRTFKGWLAGCIVASIVVEPVILVITSPSSPEATDRLATALVVATWTLPLVLIVTCILTGIPAAITVWLSERHRIRSLPFFACVGGGLGTLSHAILFQGFGWFSGLFIGAGCLAGLVYWFVAGKRAGGESKPAF
ncbi:hypothetical protein Q2941_48475 [Bradyrhizobium sp. UFLA05-153]